ncbi:MAG: hypothetical protein IPJ88_03840 [Myxococcales bacterium]|nr:MAG: hypothetical protein IPJ88_03840 [Myxococcales bacterium]
MFYRLLLALCFCALLSCDDDTAASNGDAGADTMLEDASQDDGAVSVVLESCTPSAAINFDAQEVYLDTSNTECIDSSCIVFHLDGNPAENCTQDCADPIEVSKRIFCAPRCDDSSDCANGLECLTILQNASSPSLSVRYCIPSSVI